MINWLRASTKGGTPDSKYSVPKDATPSWSSDEGGKTWKTDSWTTFGTNAGVFFCLDVCVNDPSAGLLHTQKKNCCTLEKKLLHT